MLSPLKIGTVMVQTGTFIPDSVGVQKEIFCPGWQAITNLNGDDLDRQIRGKNWNFFFVSGELQGTSWGSWNGSTVRSAAIRVLRKTQATRLNGFEITGIHQRRFLGIPRVVVTGHSRHLQKSPVLENITERIHQASVNSIRQSDKVVAPDAAVAYAPRTCLCNRHSPPCKSSSTC